MTEPVSERTKQRRRILRAAAGAPIVLTLPSGAALAASSSLNCKINSAEKAFDPEQPALGAVTSEDDWVRFKVDAYTINQIGGQVQGFKLQVDGADKWYEVNGNGTVTSVTPRGDPSPTGGSFYLLVDYDSYLNSSDPAMYVYRGDSISSPIAGASCWSSLTGVNLTGNVIN